MYLPCSSKVTYNTRVKMCVNFNVFWGVALAKFSSPWTQDKKPAPPWLALTMPALPGAPLLLTYLFSEGT